VSRSNPSEHISNPATRWFEWNGEKGVIRYYDKDAKANVDVPVPFTFLLLDQLATVRGWHDASASGIYANEVRDTTKDALVVKSFKGGTISEGLYKDIKADVNAAGGSYHANCYVAFKDGDTLKIGAFRLKGAALGAWMEFTKAHRNQVYKGAVKIDGTTEGKKGRVVFYTPTFKLVPTTADTDAAARVLDTELQQFLTAYLARAKRVQADAPHVSDEEMAGAPPMVQDYGAPSDVTDDDIPF